MHESFPITKSLRRIALTQADSRLKPIEVFPGCQKILGPENWGVLIEQCTHANQWNDFPTILENNISALGLPPYSPDLARLEAFLFELKNQETPALPKIGSLCVNPTLQVVNLGWKNLVSLLPIHSNRKKDEQPQPEAVMILLWRNLNTGVIHVCEADNEALLALKLVVEAIDRRETARACDVTIGALDRAIERTVNRGILLTPPSKIRRNPVTFPQANIYDEKFLNASVFTLQWHITQRCDLHCKHCYDRSNRVMPSFEEAVRVLDDFSDFCRGHFVSGQVSFTGGNPLLYPDFINLYRETADRNLQIALLGNPANRETIEELKKIKEPVFFQVSLEGLEKHNDSIRGDGHFQRSLQFLDILNDLNIYSMVMLTLTHDNMDQIIPLADLLRHRTDLFTFNRLSQVGEGVNLSLPSSDAYRSFLNDYLEAAKENPIISLKDSLFNILRYQNQSGLFGGCAGYGCGAAFNFVALLSDGEVHACRKFPSSIGNIGKQRLDEIYHSPLAQQYRHGCQGCRECRIRPVCGGCLAVSYSHGLNVFEERDPFCFMDQIIR